MWLAASAGGRSAASWVIRWGFTAWIWGFTASAISVDIDFLNSWHSYLLKSMNFDMTIIHSYRSLSMHTYGVATALSLDWHKTPSVIIWWSALEPVCFALWKTYLEREINVSAITMKSWNKILFWFHFFGGISISAYFFLLPAEGYSDTVNSIYKYGVIIFVFRTGFIRWNLPRISRWRAKRKTASA